MRTAGWSTFLKTYGRGTEVLPAGNYQLLIDMSKRLGVIELRGGCIVFSWQLIVVFNLTFALYAASFV